MVVVVEEEEEDEVGMHIILAPLGGSGSRGGGGIVGKCKPEKYRDEIRCLRWNVVCPCQYCDC